MTQPEPTPTLERHCQVCRRTPVTVDGHGHDQTCATCLSRVRTHITALGIMSTALLGEALVHRLDSTTVALAGPVADPEIWGYRRRAVLAQRVDPTWLEDQVDMHHPLWVLATWEREARVHLHQTLSPGTSMPTLTEARTYLDTHLTRLAHDATFAFDELANDIKVCHNHVERVLHLEEHHDRGAPCPACGQADLTKDYGDTEDQDRWTCRRCHQWWTETDYRAKVAGVYIGVAPALTASQIHEQYRIPESTLRRWANGWTDRQGDWHEPTVHKRGYDGQRRQRYDVADAVAMRDRDAGAVA